MGTGKDGYVFDFERLEVYQKALDFVTSIFRITRDLPREYQFSLGDQLRRAGISIVNNLAEGSGKLSKKEKAQFYRTSLNSARECVPMLTVLVKERQMTWASHQAQRETVVHIANMLGKLVASLESAP
jgi:four helix bundle protein